MYKSFFIALLLLINPLSTFALTPEDQGLAIVTKADSLDKGWVDQSVFMRMVLRNKHGQEIEKTTHVINLEIEGDGDKSLSVFQSPPDVKGTSFLSYSHAIGADEQWLYLPALKRVKRISSENKSGPFLGSEFAYEDITSYEVKKYSYKYIKDEAIQGLNAFVIEYYSEYKDSGYARQVVWIDQSMYQPLKIDFYDRKNTLLKTLSSYEYKQYLGQYWRPSRMEMVNHQTGKSTMLYWTEYAFRNGLTSRDFDNNSLKRAR